MSEGTFENPRLVSTEELREIRKSNLTQRITGELITLMGNGFDDGLTDKEIFESLKSGVMQATAWLETGRE